MVFKSVRGARRKMAKAAEALVAGWSARTGGGWARVVFAQLPGRLGLADLGTVRDLGLVCPGCSCGSGASEGCSSVWLPAWLPDPAGVYPGLAPSLLGGLAGDAEPGADLGPGVAAGAQALDRLGYGGVDLIGQTEHEGQGLNVAVADAAGVGAQDAPDECAVLVVLDLSPRAFWCQPGLDSIRPGSGSLVMCGCPAG